MLVCHPILALNKDNILDIHVYFCEFDDLTIFVEVDENYLNSESFFGTNRDGNTKSFLSSGLRVGEVARSFSNGVSDRHNFFVLRGNFNMDYMVGFFLSNNGDDINILNIQTWEGIGSNSVYTYTSNIGISPGEIFTEKGVCNPSANYQREMIK